jgi:ATP-binding cassette ChvD family protein
MASYQYIYVMKGLSKIYPGGRQVLKDIGLSFFPGAKIGVLGLNGAGKSTLLRVMAGLETDVAGEAWSADGVRVGFLPQEPALDPAKTVQQNVLDGVAETAALLDRFNEVSARFAEPMSEPEMEALIAEQGELQEQIDAADAWELDRKVEIAMDALRCPPGDQDVTSLSGGERRRVALCRLLLQAPDLLLLDEPTNHLDAESVAWLERHLEDYKGTVVAVTHDRYFLDNVAGWILELDRGRGIPYQGNYSAWLEQKQKRLAQDERQETARRKVLEHELEWIRQSPRARQAKSKARVRAYEELVQQSRERAPDSAQIVIPVAERLGQLVIEAEHLRKGFGDRLLIEDLSFRLPPGGIVGVIGPNGAGKTTLFRMITGQETPDGGTLRIGDTVRMAYVDQSRDTLTADKTVWEEIADGQDVIELANKRAVPSRAYVAAFNFRGADQQKRVGQLSGGERNRVHLARMLKSGANLLLLDEPTNDLDVDTLRALEEALLDFAGCVMVISHDRWFLDRIATHILAFEGDSEVVWFEGNYADYEADRRRRLGADADQPHRIKYKPLTR